MDRNDVETVKKSRPRQPLDHFVWKECTAKGRVGVYKKERKNESGTGSGATKNEFIEIHANDCAGGKKCDIATVTKISRCLQMIIIMISEWIFKLRLLCKQHGPFFAFFIIKFISVPLSTLHYLLPLCAPAGDDLSWWEPLLIRFHSRLLTWLASRQ